MKAPNSHLPAGNIPTITRNFPISQKLPPSVKASTLPGREYVGQADEEVAIAVMGATGSGKTTFINLVSGSNLRVSGGLRSCTNIVQMAVPFQMEGRHISLIDTPGFDDTTKSDTDILKMIAAFLQTSYENGKKLAGIIYMHRISDFRMGGISTRNFKMFRELCGDSTLKNVVIVTNMWGEVSREIGEAREAELARDEMFFKPVIDKKAQLVRHDNTVGSAKAILRLVIPNRPEALRIQRELVDEHLDISQTAAAEHLNRELMEQAKRHQAELRQLEEEMKTAIKEKDEETRKELEAEHNKLRKEMERVQNDSQRLASEYKEEKIKLEKRMQEMAEQAKKDNEAAAEKYNQKLSEYQKQLDEKAKAFAADKEMLERQMKEAAEQKRRDDEATAAKYDAQLKEYKDQAERIRNASAAEKEALEQKMYEITNKATQENEATAARYKTEMSTYQTQLENARQAAAADKANMEQHVAEMRRQNEETQRAMRRRGGGLFGFIGRAIDSIFGF